jgi:anti-anti-sigma factor
MDTPSPATEKSPECCPLCGGAILLEVSDARKDVLCPHCGEMLWFVRKYAGDVVILTFMPGLMSGCESVLLFDEASAALGNASRVVLNLSRLQFVSSVFLAMLLRLHKKVNAARGRLQLCGLQPETAEALRISKFDTIFAISEDEQSALRAFQP